MRYFQYLAILCCLLMVSTIGLSAEKKKKFSRAAPVVVEEAEVRQLSPIIWVSGTVISRDDARLATEVQGRLKKVAEVGTRVKQDDVVARIDNTFVKLKIEELKAAVEKEKAQLKFMRQEVKRLKRLAKQNNAAQTRLEQTLANRDIAQNELEIARSRLYQTKVEFERHTIRAPFSGVIAQRYLRRGERAAIGDDVVRLIDSNSLEIQAQVPLSTINFVQTGSELELQVSGSRPQRYKGVVRTLVPVGDERSRLMDLRIDFLTANWRVGQPVRVALPTAESKKVLSVHRDALVLRRAGSFIFTINGDNKAQKLPVNIGIASGDFIEIKGNIKEGSHVVTRGGERLRPGQNVKIISKPTSVSP